MELIDENPHIRSDLRLSVISCSENCKLHIVPAVALALLVELASEAVVCGPTDDALLVKGGDDTVRLLLDESDAVTVVGEVYESPLELLTAVFLLKTTVRRMK